MGRRFLLGGAVPVEIVCLNSSLLGQEPGVFQGHGFIGEDQLRHAAREVGWEANRDSGDADLPRAVRIAVVHHHLLPVIYRVSLAYLPQERVVGISAIEAAVGLKFFGDEVADCLAHVFLAISYVKIGDIDFRAITL